MSTALDAVQLALAAALKGDAQLQGALGGSTMAPKVYDSLAPATARVPYLVLATSGESGLGVDFAREGHDGVETLRVTAADRLAAKRIYVHVARVLDGVTLALDGHRMLDGATSWVTDYRDPVTGETQAVIRYRVQTLVGTAA